MMKAAVFHQIGSPLEVMEVPMPEPGLGEVLLRVDRCGVCGSDLHMTQEHTFGLPDGSIIGHEISGTVVDLGKGATRFRKGDPVTLIPIQSCHNCDSCTKGEPVWCQSFLFHGGGYADYMTVHEEQCFALPKTLSAEDGALIEPLAVGRHGIDVGGMQPGDTVMVVGAGPIGLACIYWAKQLGAGKIGVTARTRQREGLAMAMGADVFIDPAHASDMKYIANALGRAPDVVLECVGKPGLIQQCVEIVRPRGTVSVLGLCTMEDRFMPFEAISKEVRIQMSAFYAMSDFHDSIDAMDRGHVEPRAMITSSITLDELPEEFEALRGRTTQCKVMVKPNA